MDVLSTVVPSLVAAVSVFVVGWLGKGRFDAMREDTRTLRTDLLELRREMREDFRDVRSEIAQLRSDLTQVALAVGVKPRPETA